MKAMVLTRYGGPEALALQEMATPAPADGECLIKVVAASVNPMDSFLMRGPLFFLPAMAGVLTPKHKVFGADIAGRVEAVGRDVKGFQPGDEVFGAVGWGGFAEYACVPEDKLARKPANLSFEEAAAVPVAATTALQGLRDRGRIRPGQRVVVDGASGGVGTFAVQIAKSCGAEVTAVCSTRNMEAARGLGADHVIDYTREDFTRSGQRYDLILGANAHHSIFDYRRALQPDGIFVLAGGAWGVILQTMLVGPLLSRLGSRKLCFFIAKLKAGDLDLLREMHERGGITPVIDRRYALRETAAALRYREEGHARGKVVITVENGGTSTSFA